MDCLSAPRNYCESLPLNRATLLAWVVLDLAAIAAAFWMLASGRWGGFIGLAFGAFALTATLLVFRRLQVRVDASGVAARFGRFGPNLAHADIARVTPMRYPRRVYLGWAAAVASAADGGPIPRRFAWTALSSSFATASASTSRAAGRES